VLLVSLGLILIGAEAFTNGIEWLGQRLKLGAGAVGCILAAVGTALPETMVPIIAIFGMGKGTEGADIGIGAILGAPFMLATLAFFIAGLAALLFRRNNRRLLLDAKVVRRDLKFFLIVYTMAIFASFLSNQELKNGVAWALVLAYGVYVFQVLRDCKDGCKHEKLAPLYVAKQTQNPTLVKILVQITIALIAIVVGAHGDRNCSYAVETGHLGPDECTPCFRCCADSLHFPASQRRDLPDNPLNWRSLLPPIYSNDLSISDPVNSAISMPTKTSPAPSSPLSVKISPAKKKAEIAANTGSIEKMRTVWVRVVNCCILL